MDDQKTLGNGARRFPLRRLSKNVAEVLHDLTEMAELQGRLFAVDLRECRARVFFGIVFGAFAAVLLLATCGVAMEALAAALVEYVELSHVAGLTISATFGVVVALLLAVFAWWRLRGALKTFERSREEIRRNIAWLKDALKNAS